MNKQPLAIAICRVSTPEQEKNGSLSRQKIAVLKAAEELRVTIPDDCWWSGSVSSKRGNNVKRKDLKAMIDRCKKTKSIKYVIVDEPDRFMRSIDEAAYFEVTFRQLDVTVWYASDPELNKGDLASKLLKFTKYLSAEGSNEERQNKSISGNTTELLKGRYPFHPKPGYKKGTLSGIHEPHPVRGKALKEALVSVATHSLTPTQALIELNKSDYTKTRASLKMDKFRYILTDPYYAGILTMNKQIKVKDIAGAHKPLITKEQHKELVNIMEGKKKNQSGPRKNGNPKYPMSNLVTCELCIDHPIGRVVGYDHGNGKNPNLVYEKYRCRGCGRYLSRDELHSKIMDQFSNPINDEALEAFLEALEKVWKMKESQSSFDIRRLEAKIVAINEAIHQQVEAATDPENATIKEDILVAISNKKVAVKKTGRRNKHSQRDI